MGKSLRDKCPRHSHAAWQPAVDRPDPLALMEDSNQGRIPQLIPIRHGRMLRSPFAFYRGAALNMAADLAGTPASGIRVQACGDCHLANFGAYATPERRVIFDINDLDETLPAPWEWDVKRLAASFVLACRDNGFSKDTARDAVLSCVQSYRERMLEYSDMPVLDVWYASIDAEKLIPTIRDEEARKRFQKRLTKARERSVLEHEYPELATSAGLAPMIKENPPLIFHWREKGHEEHTANVQKAFERYRETMQEDRRILLDRFKLKDVAVKVVGVGSVGTYCGILLLMASHIRSLLDTGAVVVAAGGGGIPVAIQPDGKLVGVEAVVDKDLASGLLARDLGADMLLIPTAVPRVAIRFGQPDQQWLDTITVEEARAYIQSGEFGEGSMEPKVAAVADFVASTPGAVGVIGAAEEIRGIIAGKSGTRIVAAESAPVLLAVNGTLMRGLKLNSHMMAAGATFVRETTTAPVYRLWSFNDEHPVMVHVRDGSGVPIAVEVWSVPPAGLAGILLTEPAGLTIGKVRLEDGSTVLGVVGEATFVKGQREITQFGGWRAYIAAEGAKS
jgi:uncharacterized protein (DUF2252 family)